MESQKHIIVKTILNNKNQNHFEHNNTFEITLQSYNNTI